MSRVSPVFHGVDNAINVKYKGIVKEIIVILVIFIGGLAVASLLGWQGLKLKDTSAGAGFLSPAIGLGMGMSTLMYAVFSEALKRLQRVSFIREKFDKDLSKSKEKASTVERANAVATNYNILLLKVSGSIPDSW